MSVNYIINTFFISSLIISHLSYLSLMSPPFSLIKF